MSFDAFYRKRKALSQYLPPSERHKLKVERPRPAPVNSPLRTVIEKGDNNQTESSSSPLTSSGTSGKRRPSDPMDSEADISNDGSRMNLGSNEHESLSNGEAQPPMKRSNTVNGNNGSTVNGNNGVTVTEVETTSSSMTTSSWFMSVKWPEQDFNERKRKKVHFETDFLTISLSITQQNKTLFFKIRIKLQLNKKKNHPFFFSIFFDKGF